MARESILGTGARGKFVFQIKAKPLLCKLHSHLLKGPSAVRLANEQVEEHIKGAS